MTAGKKIANFFRKRKKICKKLILLGNAVSNRFNVVVDRSGIDWSGRPDQTLRLILNVPAGHSRAEPSRAEPSRTDPSPAQTRARMSARRMGVERVAGWPGDLGSARLGPASVEPGHPYGHQASLAPIKFSRQREEATG